MTEQQWEECEQVGPMLAYLAVVAPVPRRAVVLFACACCRDIWARLTDSRSRAAVEAAEEWAGGRLIREQMDRAAVLAGQAEFDVSHRPAFRAKRADAEAATAARAAAATTAEACNLEQALDFAAETARAACLAHGVRGRPALRSRQAALLRCIVRNPFRPAPVIDSAWLTRNDAAMLKLATVIDEGGRWGDLPMLVDALEEGGCAEPDLLNHLRRSGPHAKGCHVLRAIMER